MPSTRRRTVSPMTRRLGIAAAVFGLFVVFDILLFAFLIFDSLSQREMEQVLLEAREEAQPIATALERKAEELGGDLFVVLSVAEDTRERIDLMLENDQLVRRIEIRDRSNHVVYQRTEQPEPVDGPSELDLDAGVGVDADPGLEPGLDDEVLEGPVDRVDDLRVELAPAERAGELTEPLGVVAVPIGDIGELIIDLSDEEVRQRIAVLRADLIRQTSIVGVVTLMLLLVAVAGFVVLVRRSRALEEQANEAERMAYVGTLASGLAHEIRSPLNSLSLNMQMLEEEVPAGGSPTHQRLLSITRDEIGRLERLATDFLTYARPRPTEVAEVPVADLLGRAVGVLGGELRARGVDLESHDETGGAALRVDAGQIGQLLLNLLQNAAAATEGVDDPSIELEARLEAGAPVLEVRDNGCGIAADDRERVFDLFFSKRKGGTGLGLAIVQRIAETHGAVIELESEPGDGTTIRVVFPRSVLSGGLADRHAAEDRSERAEASGPNVPRPSAPRSRLP